MRSDKKDTLSAAQYENATTDRNKKLPRKAAAPRPTSPPFLPHPVGARAPTAEGSGCFTPPPPPHPTRKLYPWLTPFSPPLPRRRSNTLG
jgi:hypothetical protein